MKTFAEIADTDGRSECENALYKVFVNMLFSFSEKEDFLVNCENIRWNRAMAGNFHVFSNYPY